MKKLHLICNSHIDPVWMWDWEEGLGEAISTFYQAEQFLREYDYIFNHNEALLYEFVEEKDPELFKAILEQVKAGNGTLWAVGICSRTVICPPGKPLSGRYP